MKVKSTGIRCACCGETVEGVKVSKLWQDKSELLLSLEIQPDAPPMIIRVTFQQEESAETLTAEKS
jgi:hypothetical protein